MIGVRRQSRGFTLLEMLVATAMIAVLAGSFYTTLHTAFKARSASARVVQPVRRVKLALELLQDDFQSAMIPRGVLAGEFVGEDGLATDGQSADSVLVHCAVGAKDRSGPGGDVRKVELFCEDVEDTGDRCLVRYVTANLLASVAEEPRREVICRGVYAFNVRYFDGADWQDGWDAIVMGDVLPLAVEVTIQLAEERDSSGGEGGYAASRVFPIPCSSLLPGVSAGIATAVEGAR